MTGYKNATVIRHLKRILNRSQRVDWFTSDAEDRALGVAIDRIREFERAAKAVVEAWEGGDLSGTVNALAGLVDQ